MKVICVGFPKTGSKTLSACLNHFGYKVADLMENVEMNKTWLRIMERKIPFSRILREYKKRGYNANQDVPSTLYWREFVTHCPKAKVILTVRDSGEQWFESRLRWVRSLRKYSIGGIFPFWLLLFLMSFGFMGKTAKRQMKIMQLWMERFLKIKPGFDFCFQEEYERFFIENKAMMIENYNDHILRVTRSVPASRLLVWNVKDGWEPLAKFLNKPIPEIPLPMENASGSNVEWRRRNWNDHPIMKEAREKLFVSLIMLASFLFILFSFILLRPVAQ
ncbi:Oidioi.mRNA.OKI2018_I69.PAR.g8978.t1.cds [Oikopleura dioica]|uniref:Oidioi.mRNA.OKI2018_I69.PAR.g8978.t1.cds n=1 Tax=Oikopleura dioica TaxID=34765 RepID=A0ABN7RIH0_OIKDI|nr:Oidioi.mRNA.OKI2018_I69.PAR.g8978.t1.cds [Oikopleura dioica]